MQVILTENVVKLGTAGDLVSVKPGYARNYLIPQKLAVLASTNNVKEFEHQKRVAALRADQAKAAAEALGAKLGALNLSFARKVGEHDKLFGSVTSHDVERALGEAGFDISRRVIDLPETIKELGTHQFTVRLHREVDVQVNFEVVAE